MLALLQMMTKSPDTIELIKTIIFLTSMVLLPYLALFSGSLILSIVFNLKFLKKANPFHNEIAIDLIDVLTEKKVYPVLFAFIPLLIIYFSLNLLLGDAVKNLQIYLLASIAGFLLTSVLAYAYKHALHFEQILREQNKQGESGLYYSKVFTVKKYYGIFAAVILIINLITLFVFLETVYSRQLMRYQELFSSVLTLNFIIKTVQFISLGILFVSIVYLFEIFRTNTSLAKNEIIKNYIQVKFSLIALSAILAVPFFIVVSSIFADKLSLDYNYFYLAFVIVLLFLALAHYIYKIFISSVIEKPGRLLVLFSLIILLLIAQDYYRLITASKYKLSYLNEKYISEQIKK